MEDFIKIHCAERNVDDVLASYKNSLATEANLDRLNHDRDSFFKQMNLGESLLELSIPKTSNEWTAIIKICEKLMKFDHMYFRNPIVEQLADIRDIRAQGIIDELG